MHSNNNDIIIAQFFESMLKSYGYQYGSGGLYALTVMHEILGIIIKCKTVFRSIALVIIYKHDLNVNSTV